MTDNLTPPASNYDDELSKFTDELLDGNLSDMPELATDEFELKGLQETVLRLQQTFDREEPAEDMASRIHARLVAEWERANLSGKAARQQASWRSAGSRKRVYRLGLAFSAVAALIIVVLLSGLPDDGGTASGAALQGNVIVPIIALAGIVLAGVIWWFYQRRR